MTDPIYPDKTKTGLAALKPLFVAFCDEPERWVREWLDGEEWTEVPLYDAVYLFDIVNRQVRLTPKPRRVWIGDQELLGVCERFPDVVAGCWWVKLYPPKTSRILRTEHIKKGCYFGAARRRYMA